MMAFMCHTKLYFSVVKVLQIINTLDTGGAEKLLLDIVPKFNQAGVGVIMDVLVLEGMECYYLNKLKEIKCCRIFALQSNSLYNPINIVKIIPYLFKYNVVHVHLFPAQYWVAIAKILSFSKVTLVYTEHSTFNRRRKFFFFKFLDKIIYNLYHKTICISNGVNEQLLTYIGISRHKLITIENGIDLKQYVDAKPYLKTEIHDSISHTDKLIVQVSKFRKEKDQITVINSMKYLSENVKLIFVGEGELREDCQNLVDRLNLNNRIFFLGARNDVANILKTSDLSIISSHWEGFGLVAVEGMAVGKPVIASNVLGLSDVVKNAGLLFEKGNERELASLIDKLFSNPNFYDEISFKCKEKALKYDLNLMIQHTLELYKNIN
jgi:glycosyltransferase involved in cell wall biosynthesis